jgi:tripartite-type tricarboxylate transporter receptor subunit TctC
MRSRRRLAWLGLLVLTIGLGPQAGAEQGEADDFYHGKTLRLIVGFAAGGGYDASARVLARHIGQRIPGHPRIVVENMPGSGSLIAANHLYRVARPDGLTVGHFAGSLLLGQVLGHRGIEFDARGFAYLGAPAREHVAYATLRDPAFLAEAERTRLEIEPVSGREIERHVGGLFTMDPALVSRLRAVLLE